MLVAEAVQFPPWVGLVIIVCLVAIVAGAAALCAAAAFVVAVATLRLRGTGGRPTRVWPWLAAAAVLGAGCVFAFAPLGFAAPLAVGVVWWLTDPGSGPRRRRG